MQFCSWLVETSRRGRPDPVPPLPRGWARLAFIFTDVAGADPAAR